MHEHVFVDESKSRGFVLVAVVVPPDELAGLRGIVKSLKYPGQDRLHFSAESDGRRRQMLKAYTEAGFSATIYDATGFASEITAREAAIARLADDAAKMGAARMVLEADEPAVPSDKRIIFERLDKAGVQMQYCHMKASAECLLALPDAVAWSWVKGNHWKRLVQPLVADVVMLEG